MRVLYFAWLRERVGLGEELVHPPEAVRSAGDLLDWLAGRDERHAAAFAHRALVRIAVNQSMAGRDEPVSAGDEVAFFPPVTGG